jgi:hypothetical protein
VAIPGADFRNTPPTQVPGVEGALELSLSSNRACARTPTTIQCWGRHRVESPVNVASDITAIWADSYSLCTLNGAGVLQCEQTGESVVLRIPTPNGAAQPAAPQWVSAPLAGVTEPQWVGVDDYTLCAGGAGQALVCDGFDEPPVGHSFDAVHGHDCLVNDGRVTCLGETVSGLRNIEHVRVARLTGCARDSRRALSCWGIWSSDSEVESLPRVRASRVRGLSDVRQFSPGGWTSCAVDGTGQLYCWPGARPTPLGSRPERIEATPVEGLDNVVAVGAGRNHVCAVLTTGHVKCWGAGAHGQLGTGQLADAATPVDVVGLNDAIAIDAGEDVTCVVRREGQVACWGHPPDPARLYGVFGEQHAEAVVPQTISGLPPAASVFLAERRACMITRAGGVVCWGDHRLPVGGSAE